MTSAQVRLANLLAIGKTRAAMQDAGATPLVQAGFGDLQLLDGLQIVQHFGFSSSPPLGSNVVAAFVGGDKSRGLIIGSVEPGSRRKLLLSGETVVHDQWGNEAHFGQHGITISHATSVTIKAAGSITLDAADVIVTGNLHVQTGVTGATTDARGKITAYRSGIAVNIF